MLALAAPMSLLADSRARQRTDLAALAADLERALGRGHVEVSGRPSRSTSSFEEAVVAQMNEQRAAAGLRPLRINSRLSLAAGDRMEDMFNKRYFNHVAPDGLQPWAWVQKRGYIYRGIGENLAVGYPSASRVVDGWMHSPGHRANVLGSRFDEVGVAIADGSPTRGYSGPTVVALYGVR
jgi:uncharacterized protein YkwD